MHQQRLTCITLPSCFPLTATALLQVLNLPAHLSAAVCKESSVNLDMCLETLSPDFHEAALSAIFPDIVGREGSLCIRAARKGWSIAPMDSQENFITTGATRPRKNTCIATTELLCSVLKLVASSPQLSVLHLDVLARDNIRKRFEKEICANLTTVGDEEDKLFDQLSAALLTTISALPHLKSLSLGGAFITHDVLNAIAPVLPGLQFLEQFSVIGGFWTPESSELVEHLGSCDTLKRLSLSAVDTPVGYAERELHMRSLAVSVSNMQSLESLELCTDTCLGTFFAFMAISVKPLPLADPQAFLGSPEHVNPRHFLPNILHLKIRNGAMYQSEWGMQALRLWLPCLCSLQHLSLTETSCRSMDALLLAPALSEMTGLRSLNMSSNPTLDEPSSNNGDHHAEASACGGISAISKALANITTLVRSPLALLASSVKIPCYHVAC